MAFSQHLREEGFVCIIWPCAKMPGLGAAQTMLMYAAIYARRCFYGSIYAAIYADGVLGLGKCE